jgi:hypothetical protein
MQPEDTTSPIDPRQIEPNGEAMPIEAQPELPREEQDGFSYRGLAMGETERKRLARHIEQEINVANADHQERLRRFAKYRDMFRQWTQPPRKGEEHVSPYRVPIFLWTLLAAWSRMVDAVTGEDSEVVAEPRGPSDQKVVTKIARYFDWLLDMSGWTRTWLVWSLRALIYGRAFVYRPWELRVDGDGNTVYDGPSVLPLEPEQVILPGVKAAIDVHTAPWVALQFERSPQSLLDGERAGRYFGVKEDFGTLVRLAQMHGYLSNQPMSDAIDQEGEHTGIQINSQSQSGDTLFVLEWYGRWRLPLDPATEEDVPIDDFGARSMDETDVLVRCLPEDNYRVIGVERLKDIYPKMEHIRPISELRLVHDGSLWPPGMGEMIETNEDELTSIWRQFMASVKLASAPILLYKPASGLRPEVISLEPGTAIPCEDPNGAKWLTVQPDYAGLINAMQFLMSIVERLTGISDMALGRTVDRPNAPRTATGQVAMLEAGNTRLKLDRIAFSEDLSVFLFDVWEMVCSMGAPELFFRVTEEDAGGLLQTSGGFAKITAEERAGRFDFRLKFATSPWAKAARDERTLQRYQLDLGNPLIATNPQALWSITNEVHKALGDESFEQMVPPPPELDVPKNARLEWALMQQGEEAPVHPLDNDQQHLMEHEQQLVTAQQGEYRDEDAEVKLLVHIRAHREQLVQKQAAMQIAGQMMQAMAAGMGAQAQATAPEDAEPGASPSMGGAPPAASPVPGPATPQMPAVGETMRQNIGALMGGGGA